MVVQLYVKEVGPVANLILNTESAPLVKTWQILAPLFLR